MLDPIVRKMLNLRYQNVEGKFNNIDAEIDAHLELELSDSLFALGLNPGPIG